MSNISYWAFSFYKGASSAAPQDPVSGTMYYDTGDNKLYVYSNGWVAIGPDYGHLLYENNDTFLAESGEIMRVE